MWFLRISERAAIIYQLSTNRFVFTYIRDQICLPRCTNRVLNTNYINFHISSVTIFTANHRQSLRFNNSLPTSRRPISILTNVREYFMADKALRLVFLRALQSCSVSVIPLAELAHFSSNTVVKHS